MKKSSKVSVYFLGLCALIATMDGIYLLTNITFSYKYGVDERFLHYAALLIPFAIVLLVYGVSVYRFISKIRIAKKGEAFMVRQDDGSFVAGNCFFGPLESEVLTFSTKELGEEITFSFSREIKPEGKRFPVRIEVVGKMFVPSDPTEAVCALQADMTTIKYQANTRGRGGIFKGYCTWKLTNMISGRHPSRLMDVDSLKDELEEAFWLYKWKPIIEIQIS